MLRVFPGSQSPNRSIAGSWQGAQERKLGSLPGCHSSPRMQRLALQPSFSWGPTASTQPPQALKGLSNVSLEMQDRGRPGDVHLYKSRFGTSVSNAYSQVL